MNVNDPMLVTILHFASPQMISTLTGLSLFELEIQMVPWTQPLREMLVIQCNLNMPKAWHIVTERIIASIEKIINFALHSFHLMIDI